MIIELPNVIDEIRIASYKKSLQEINLAQKQKAGTYNREGTTLNIFHHPELEYINVELRGVISELIPNVILPRIKPRFDNIRDTGFEYHKYSPGEICHVHGDGETTEQVGKSYLRFLTFILFLTTNESGDLVFPAQNVSVKPQAGKVVLFPPYGFYHHYTKPDTASREIIMTWFVYSDWELIPVKYD